MKRMAKPPRKVAAITDHDSEWQAENDRHRA